MLDSLTTAVVLAAADGEVALLNAGAEHLFGVSRRRAIGRRLPDLLPGLDALEELLQRAGESEQSFGRNLTFSVPHEDRMNIEVACRVSRYRSGRPGDLLIEFFDATQWRQIDREIALMSQRGVSRRIIRQLAHEVRNPLGGLRGAAQLLQRELTDAGQLEYTQVIISEADRLVALTDSLLGPTRKPEPVAANIHELLERVLLLIDGEARPGIRIFRDYDPSLPDVRVDRDQIIQALLNIGRNALQALGEQGDLLVRTRVLSNFMVGDRSHRLVASIEIEDNGAGIPADIADSIFYPLVTGREQGTGLGLPLAQDLVSRHGGLIEYESAPGRTVFMVRLPIAEAAG